MRISLLFMAMVLCMVLDIPAFLTSYESDFAVQENPTPGWLVIDGLVENPLNISYAELKKMPLVSEVTMLQCVGGGYGGPSVTYNWTGVPLFYLLSLAKVIPGDYREVVFRSTDLFSTSISLETAMQPTTIFAFWGNGTDLEQVSNWLGIWYKIVVPCRWGYKWAKWVKRIEVVDYDYKGTYEQLGYSDEALRPNCAMPQTTPPIQNYTATYVNDYTISALSNSSIESFKHRFYTQFIFNVTGLDGTNGYFYVTFLKDLLTEPYRVFADENQIEYGQTDVGGRVYLLFTYPHSTHVIKIEGNLQASDGGEGGGGICLLR